MYSVSQSFRNFYFFQIKVWIGFYTIRWRDRRLTGGRGGSHLFSLFFPFSFVCENTIPPPQKIVHPQQPNNTTNNNSNKSCISYLFSLLCCCCSLCPWLLLDSFSRGTNQKRERRRRRWRLERWRKRREGVLPMEEWRVNYMLKKKKRNEKQKKKRPASIIGRSQRELLHSFPLHWLDLGHSSSSFLRLRRQLAYIFFQAKHFFFPFVKNQIILPFRNLISGGFTSNLMAEFWTRTVYLFLSVVVVVVWYIFYFDKTLSLLLSSIT